ncbi:MULTISPECIES: enoyl-CoA hydratase/isomerase [Paenibacillus]|uniref:Enoyl-CoA hydratase n=2 Tax=Paenibacillus TaxID=44249 RepID=A0ABX2ZFJ8_PAEPO|nr:MULTISPECIES: enoyl-CoA hydratase/isomerase [Paenibacillus]APB75209.1 enoyl-CoA hydratase [Paenibacillus polymyxa]MDR6776751.1 polyketide biosynthesis enoyl-CoA hydratase PksH [Paenibacillus peoriae]ODA09096.1 enoyl-CoA hydratase [Paenibacillus polymyxa]OME71992.1 enoyl-CoA hydratase [Paenibacillus peoriae]POR27889.1 enoyl-CoA hydratase [Paenibacillus polymyxa]
MSYQTIQVRFQESICYIRFYRPEANNTINNTLIEECLHVLALCEESVTIVVLEGLPEVFCFGADFEGMREKVESGQEHAMSPEPMYDLWLKLATGPYITISHVRGKANAGGVGFIAASDIVIADETAQFSLSELLFGLFPACVLPFLVRRIGFQKAHYLTLMTQPVSVQQAHVWGVVDAYDAQSEMVLRKHLLRLRRLSKHGILRYKRFMDELNDLRQCKPLALASNQEVFSDAQNLKGIFRYVETGQFPWMD